MEKYWEQINELIDRTLLLEPHLRVPFIKEKCGSNKELMQEAINYLSSIEQAEKDDFLASDLILSATFADEVSSLIGHSQDLEHIIENQIGPYQVKKLLGEGGMGAVYLAERVDGEFDQKVAIKFLRQGFYSPHLRNRFRQEKNILSRLHHPHIARLLDGGITKEGSPYFIMEFVEGQSVHRFCNENNLRLDERLALFLQVCDAVDHAHSKLVVHRDLKPENIYVTADGQVKVMDFGIAKLLSDDPDDVSENFTKEGHIVISFNFAAPEQFEAGVSTVKTDVYGLGALLYLLVTDDLAFNFKGESIPQIERAIRYQQPERPKNLEKDNIGGISPDLEAIILKALRKEPDERYDSVDHLRDDIQRLQKNLPVLARKGTVRYRANKFIKRNAMGIAATLFILFSIAGFTLYHFNQLTKERNIANAEAEKVNQIKDLMIDIFSANNPRSASFANTDLTVSQALSMGIEQVTENMSENPEVYTELLSTIGTTLTNIEDYENAYTAYRFALDQTSEFYGENSIEYSVALSNFANLMSKADSLGRAKELMEKSIDITLQLENVSGMDVANRYGIYGFILGQLGDFDDAKQILERADSIYVENGFGETIARYNSLSNLADLNIALRNYSEAEEALMRATQFYETIYDSLHVDIVTNTTKLGQLYMRKGENRRAEEYMLRALRQRVQVYGEESSYTAAAHSNLFSNYRILDELDKALFHASRQTEITKAVYGEESAIYSQALNNLALAQQEVGNMSEAEKNFRESIRIKEIHFPPTSTYLAVSYYNFANLMHAQEKYHAALDLFQKVLEIDRENYGEDHPEIAIDLNKVAVVQRDMEDYEGALLTFQTAGKIFEEKYPETHYRVAEYHMDIGKMYNMQEQIDPALEHFDKALQIYRHNFDDSHSSVREAEEYVRELSSI